MHQVFIEGGLIRKLWRVETHAYRDHLLRLDAESRHSRFGAAIADDMIRTYAATANGSDVIVHGFFVDGVLRGAADLRIFGSLYRREAEAAFSIEKPWQSRGYRLGAARTQPARRAQPRRQAPARMLPRGEPAHAATRPQIRGRPHFRFRHGDRQGRKPASDAAVGHAGTGGRRSQFRRCLCARVLLAVRGAMRESR